MILACVLSMTAFTQLNAQTEADNNYRRGWHWYEEKITTPEESTKEMQEKPENGNNSEDPSEKMKLTRETIQRALDKAVLNPTKENVTEYIKLQNQLSSQASRFQHQWQAALLEHPEEDYSVQHPTNTVGRQVEIEAEKKSEEAVLRELAKNSGLFFFYRSTCPYCRRFAPIVRNFSENYHIPVVAVTTDGVALPEFPDSVPDRGQAARFNVQAEPALFAVNPYTHKAFPIAYGLTSEDEIRRNLLNIATHYQGDVS